MCAFNHSEDRFLAKRILLIEDETIMISLLSAFLEKAGYQVIPATTAGEALATLEKETPELILLDLGLPDEDGIVVLRKIRTTSKVPIVVLSARSENEQRTTALELGADDFVNKGVDPQELLLRISNILGKRDIGPADSIAPPAENIGFAGWTLDMNARTVLDPTGRDVHLTPSEFHILAALVNSAGGVTKRQVLVDAISGIEDGPTERALDTYINRLRKKIEANPRKPEIIVTMKGIGYRLKRDPV